MNQSPLFGDLLKQALGKQQPVQKPQGTVQVGKFNVTPRLAGMLGLQEAEEKQSRQQMSHTQSSTQGGAYRLQEDKKDLLKSSSSYRDIALSQSKDIGEYSEESLTKLLDALRPLVGEDVARQWVSERFRAGVSYGLPVKDNNTYTGYGVLRNLDIKPEQYLTDVKPNLMSETQWAGGGTPSAGGRHSILSGIEMPKTSDYVEELVLVHEQQHDIDANRGVQGYGHPKVKEAMKRREETLASISEKMRQHYEPSNAEIGAFTGQEENYEVLTQIRSYAANLPAWWRLQSSEFWRKLTNDEKATILDGLAPPPKEADAMVGANYNF